jgi:hypothetical protein
MSVANQARGAPFLAREVRGATHVAAAFQGRARAAQAATINGEPDAVWAVSGKVLAALVFASDPEKITGIDIIMEPERLATLDVVIGTAWRANPLTSMRSGMAAFLRRSAMLVSGRSEADVRACAWGSQRALADSAVEVGVALSAADRACRHALVFRRLPIARSSLRLFRPAFCFRDPGSAPFESERGVCSRAAPRRV